MELLGGPVVKTPCFPYIWNLEKWYWWTYFRAGIKMQTEDERVDTAGVEERRMNWESSTDIYTLPCVKYTASGKLLQNTGSPAQCSVMARVMGWGWGGRKIQEGEGICMLTANSHYWMAKPAQHCHPIILQLKKISLFTINIFSSVQLLSHVWIFVTPWTAARQASLPTNSQSFLKLMSIESVMPSNHLLCCPLLLPPSIFPRIRVFSNESVLHIRWPKYWSFSFNISPSNNYLGLISFRMDWLDLLAVWLSRVFSNTTVQRHQFFGAQLSL